VPSPPSETSAARVDRPPDGWSRLRPNTHAEVIDAADLRLRRATIWATAAVGRRDLISGFAKTAAVLAIGSMLPLMGRNEAAGYADTFNYCDPFGPPPSGPCGPSGLCPSDKCNNGQCMNPQKIRQYGGTSCCGACSGTDNCWRENCCDTAGWNSKVKCCDCCITSVPGVACTDCLGADGDKCICRAKVGDPC
jgi:hypothetical protein